MRKFFCIFAVEFCANHANSKCENDFTPPREWAECKEYQQVRSLKGGA